nr:MAG TPA_asm: hypothetical protein [Caudoviricetes sp.]
MKPKSFKLVLVIGFFSSSAFFTASEIFNVLTSLSVSLRHIIVS